MVLALACSSEAIGQRDRESTPALAQLAELTASDGTAFDDFGGSVAVSEDTVVVGADTAQVGLNEREGAAYVFVKPSSGWSNMTQVAKLTPSNGVANFYFGGSVAISGNTIVIDAAPENPGGGAYVFVMPSGGWKDMTETAILSYGPLNFSSVAISGDVVIAGAPAAWVGGIMEGAAFVFVKPKNGWRNSQRPTAELTASDGSYSLSFGESVAISGNRALIGAIYANTAAGTDRGAAYLFLEPDSGWANAIKAAKLTASDGQSGDLFGIAVAIGDATFAVGAPQHGLGAEYVFIQPSDGWTSLTTQTERAELNADGSCWFGVALRISPGVTIAGESSCGEGAAYLYEEPNSGWQSTSQPTVELTPSDGFYGDEFGASVSTSGATIVIGAPKGTLSPGAAYVF